MSNQWNKFVQTLNLAHKDLFPRIMTQGLQGQWKSLKEDFPLDSCDYPADILSDFLEVNNWFIVNFSKLGLQEEHASKEEKSAIDIQKMVSELSLIHI